MTVAPHHESRQTLWILAIPPGIWALHFLASYVTAAIWCAKRGAEAGTLDPVRLAIAAYTVVALVAIAWIGRIGWQRHGDDIATEPHDFDTPHDRHRFLGFATLLLAGLSFVATIYVALVVVFIGSCVR